MKLSEYIKCLQNLKKEHGDVDVMINNQYECVDLSVIEKVVKADEPYYHEDEFCVVIEDNYITYD